ncbi:GNAT family N-acetyltransferase [Paenibacillus sp. SI8]|uniref:GNAT family N-acetyltransferase n=1 Tax=unclassified Paenibacillus TaxID=185978 RepID=UPI0034667FA3
MVVRGLRPEEPVPLDLLLLADPSEIIVREYLSRGECYIAERNSVIIGVYVLLPTRPGTIELVNIAVSDEEQGRGIGKLLVNHAICMARQHGYLTIEVGTGNSSIDQLALYQKCGFRMDWIDRDFFIKHYAEPIVEQGIPCTDMVRLSQTL